MTASSEGRRIQAPYCSMPPFSNLPILINDYFAKAVMFGSCPFVGWLATHCQHKCFVMLNFLFLSCCVYALRRFRHKIHLVGVWKEMPILVDKNRRIFWPQNNLEMYPGVLKNIQSVTQTAVGSLAELWACYNATTIPSTSWCDRWLKSI